MMQDFSLTQRASFWARSRGLMVQRTLRNLTRNDLAHPGNRAAAHSDGAAILAEVRTPLFTTADAAERQLELGKVENLRVAARAMDGLLLSSGAVFSFWRVVGRPVRSRGFVIGRELRHGCLIPSIAGGICQLSNSLCRAARLAGMDIVERHAHSAPSVDGLTFDPEDDATVFWNYVDFRFRATQPVRLSVRLDAESLIVRLLAQPDVATP